MSNGERISSSFESRPSADTNDGIRTTGYGKQAEVDLAYFYPTSVLVTAPEIIFFWVARMVMAGFEFMGEIPFRNVYIHGTVRDIEGRKMSKSLGNIIDPSEIIREYGSDALRFSLVSLTSTGQDVYLSKERFEQGRNFANKIWNASRFITLNLEPVNARFDLCQFYGQKDPGIINKWILSRFYSALKDVNKYLDSFNFNEAANSLYAFFWHEFCDWYLELIKPDIKNVDNQVVMYKILEKFLRIMHPVMPFVTEEIWQRFPHDSLPIMTCPWPHLQEQIIDVKSEHKMQFIFEVIAAIRNMRSEIEIPGQEKIEARIFIKDKAKSELLSFMSLHIQNLARLSQLTIDEDYHPLKGQFVRVLKEMHLVIPLAGIVDIEAQKKKIDAKIKNAEADIKTKKTTLGNLDFIKRAPSEIVEKEKDKLNELIVTLKKLKAVKNGLQ